MPPKRDLAAPKQMDCNRARCQRVANPIAAPKVRAPKVVVPEVVNNQVDQRSPSGAQPAAMIRRCVLEGPNGFKLQREVIQYNMPNSSAEISSNDDFFGNGFDQFPESMRSMFMMSPFASPSKGSQASIKAITEEGQDF